MEEGPSKDDFRPSASLQVLQRRSDLLRKLRSFFHERQFMEVETPLLASEVIPELHIEPIEVTPPHTPSRIATRCTEWLQASPEASMKRLLAAGAEAIFQITRSFREGEQGRLHNREFTIVEWYRVGDDMLAGMKLLSDLCQALLDTPAALHTSYAEAFERHVGIDPHDADCQDLARCAARLGIQVPSGMEAQDRDAWLHLLLTMQVEQKLGRDGPEILYDYPASQAALSKIRTEKRAGKNIQVAERFELYWHGIELANGYHELTDAGELRDRLTGVNRARQAEGRPKLPLPERLLAAMEHGLPDCAGVALGFDRLVMLAAGAESIQEVMTKHEARPIP